MSSEQILRRYEAGERDFSGLEIEDEPEVTPLRGAVLDGALFNRAFIVAVFSGASLRGAQFVEANVKTCVYDGADLTDADFTNAALCATTFQRARMDGAKFDGANFHSYTLGAGERPHW